MHDFLQIVSAVVMVLLMLVVFAFLFCRYEDALDNFLRRFSRWSKNVGRKRK